MQLAFAMPHLMEVTAITTGWERAVTGAEQQALAKFADDLGFAMIAVPEHFVIPTEHKDLSGDFYFSAYPGMAFYAGATSRIRVNSCISILPLRNPVITAKDLSTIDWMSGGRATVTFASGWLEGEYEAMGVDFHQRGAMAEEYTQAIIALWTQDVPQFEGKFVSFRDVLFAPKPVQQPHLPIWFGGEAPAVLRRIGRYGTGWWPFLTRPEAIPEKLDYIRSQPDYAGKLAEVFYGMSTARLGEGHVALDDPDARPGQSKQEIIDRLGWFATLGVTMSSVPIPEVRGLSEYRDYVQWVAEEIMPAVQ
jgi:probable F420-dependent oxidoreductase